MDLENINITHSRKNRQSQRGKEKQNKKRRKCLEEVCDCVCGQSVVLDGGVISTLD